MNNENQSSEKKTKKITFGLVFSWLFGISVGVPAIMMLTEKGETVAGIILLAVVLIVFPPTATLIAKHLHLTFSRGLKIFLILAGCTVAGIIIANHGIATTPLEQQDAQTIKAAEQQLGAASTPSSTQKVYNVGDQIQLGDSVVTVNSASFSQGGEFITPSTGNTFLNLNITIQNTSSSQEDISTLGQMFIRDAAGNSYQVTPTDKSMEDPSADLDGAVIANSKRTGWVGFEIPKSDTGLQFQYNGSIFGGGTILVNLGK
jgi:hypothetical protein